MKAVLVALLASFRAGLRTRVALQLEVLALRHQLAVYQRHRPRARTQLADRLLWSYLSRTWADWRNVLVFVKPSTVIAWQRRRSRDHWARLSRGAPGRPAVSKAVRELNTFTWVDDHRNLATCVAMSSGRRWKILKVRTSAPSRSSVVG